MPHYHTVIFDLDGTLLDTLDDLADAVNFALTQKGWPARTREQVQVFVGNGVGKLMERAVPSGTSPRETAQALALFKEYYERHNRDKTAPYPGIPQLLDALRAKGCMTAVVSNKFDPAVKELMAHYFPGRLDAAAGEGEGSPKKPDPAMVLRVMADLGADPAATVYVGDSDVDIATARNAGLPCISVTWGFRDRDFLLAAGADRLADTPAQLLAML